MRTQLWSLVSQSMAKRFGALALVLSCAAVSAGPIAVAQQAPDPNTTYLTAEAGGADYSLQGEYTGQLPLDNQMTNVGLQVVSEGGGNVAVTLFRGGLPGDGWDGIVKMSLKGSLKDGKVRVQADQGYGIVEHDVVTAHHADGTKIAELRRVERTSPTLGMKPPEGAVVLFDGSTADHFEGGMIDEEGLLMQGVTSKQHFKSFDLHLEFRTPFMPFARGQARANSGCYFQGRYEVQILDSFGLEGKNNEAGGLYEIKDPKVNMCLPPLVWQTYDVEYTAAMFDESGKKTKNARVTIRHNGVVVQDKVELPMATRAAPWAEGAEAGPIYLQDHGNPVRFRNIWVLEK